MKMYKPFIFGTLLAIPLLTFVYNFMNSPQCPDEYTKEQIEASNCIIGANIGIGLFIIAAPVLWLAIVATVHYIIKDKNI